MDHPIIAEHPPELVARIMEIILSSGLRSVHYTGSADEGLLRAMIAHKPLLKVSVMDMPDRWGTGYAFWYDEREFGNCLPRERPDWLDGVPFYQEGAPDHEVGIRDCPWDSARQFWKIVAFTGRRPPLIVIHFGKADTVDAYVCEDGESRLSEPVEKRMIDHPSYTWEEHNGLRIGRWKSGVVPAYENDREKHR